MRVSWWYIVTKQVATISIIMELKLTGDRKTKFSLFIRFENTYLDPDHLWVLIKIHSEYFVAVNLCNCANRYRPHDHEHLMIIYYDVLMIDNESLLSHRQAERRRRLERLITCRKGCAEIVESQVVVCSRLTAAAELRQIFAKCITNRVEGVVLKPDTPYFDFSPRQQPYTCCNIKLKKEYIQGWGDVGDFAVIGASYAAAQARNYKLSNLKWTHFYIGCLENYNQVRAGNELARFAVVNIVELNEALMKTFLTHCNPQSVAFGEQDTFKLVLHGIARTKPPSVVFKEPAIFDVRCFSFDKEPGSSFWSMRFPMVSRIHFDRSYIDAITFEELQEAANAATEMPQQEDSQEMRDWICALEKADPRGIAVDAVSQQSIFSGPKERSGSGNDQEDDSGGIGIVKEGPRLVELALACASDIRDVPATLVPRTSPAMRQDSISSQSLETIGAETERQMIVKRRSSSDDKRVSKNRRLLCPNKDTLPSTGSTERDTARLPTPMRQPLGQIDQNVPTPERTSRDIKSSAESTSPINKSRDSDTKTVEYPPVVSLQTSNMDSVPSSSGQSNDPSPQLGERLGQVESTVPPGSHTITCSHVGEKCIFANKSILLSPCIATYAWVTGSLLKDHGITDYIVDPVSWARDETASERGPVGSSSVLDTTHDLSSSSKTRPVRARKICLVESRREDATHAFLKKIEESNLRTRSGKREWIAVYDWRILEKATELESRGRGVGSYDPWRQFYYGIT